MPNYFPRVTLICLLIFFSTFLNAVSNAFADVTEKEKVIVVPEVELSGIKIGDESLEDLEPRLPIEELKTGEVHVTGSMKSNVPLDTLNISFDNGSSWEKIDPKPQWSILFKPVVDKDYEVKFKAVVKGGKEVEATGYPKSKKFRFVATENAEQVLSTMAKAYESKDKTAFMSRVADDFSYRGELEEFSKRDFRDYDSIKINLFIKKTTFGLKKAIVQADWQMHFFPTALSVPVEVRGTNLDFVFENQKGILKLKAMRGANPLFGARSPDIAAMTGASGTTVSSLTTIEDTGSRVSKQTAMTVVGSSDSTIDPNTTPVNMNIISLKAVNDAGDEVDSGALFVGNARFRIRVSLVDNPKNVNLTNVLFETTDSRTGTVLRGHGDILAGQINAITTDNSENFPAIPGLSGTITFILDADKQYTLIDRSTATTRDSYTT